MTYIKPIVSITINGILFHFADSQEKENAIITSFEYEDTDGTDEKDNKKKGKRDELRFKFVNFDPETQRFRSDSSLFRNGNIVRFTWGYFGDLELTNQRTMKIVEVKETFPDGIEMVTVVCHDLSKQMNTEEKDVLRPVKGREDNEKKKYSLNQVIEEVTKESGLIYSTYNRDPKFDELKSLGWQQKKETNIQFLQRLASDYGAEVYVENKILTFATKTKIVKRRPWGYLHRGINEEFYSLTQRGKRVAKMISFEPSVTLEESKHTVESKDVSSKTNKKVDEKSEETRNTTVDFDRDTGLPGNDIQTTSAKGEKAPATDTSESSKTKTKDTPLNSADAKAKAEGDQQQGSESAITASASLIPGDPRLKAKTTVLVTGRLSKKWRGSKWYIKSILHKIDSSGYSCSLDLTSPPQIAAKDNKNKAPKKEQGKEAEDTTTVNLEQEINRDTGEKGNIVATIKNKKTTTTKTILKKKP